MDNIENMCYLGPSSDMYLGNTISTSLISFITSKAIVLSLYADS